VVINCLTASSADDESSSDETYHTAESQPSASPCAPILDEELMEAVLLQETQEQASDYQEWLANQESWVKEEITFLKECRRKHDDYWQKQPGTSQPSGPSTGLLRARTECREMVGWLPPPEAAEPGRPRRWSELASRSPDTPHEQLLYGARCWSTRALPGADYNDRWKKQPEPASEHAAEKVEFVLGESEPQQQEQQPPWVVMEEEMVGAILLLEHQQTAPDYEDWLRGQSEATKAQVAFLRWVKQKHDDHWQSKKQEMEQSGTGQSGTPAGCGGDGPSSGLIQARPGGENGSKAGVSASGDGG
jgi:hypothetical protein